MSPEEQQNEYHNDRINGIWQQLEHGVLKHPDFPEVAHCWTIYKKSIDMERLYGLRVGVQEAASYCLDAWGERQFQNHEWGDPYFDRILMNTEHLLYLRDYE